MNLFGIIMVKGLGSTFKMPSILRILELASTRAICSRLTNGPGYNLVVERPSAIELYINWNDNSIYKALWLDEANHEMLTWRGQPVIQAEAIIFLLYNPYLNK